MKHIEPICTYESPYHWDTRGLYKQLYEYPVSLAGAFLNKGLLCLDVGCGDGKHTSMLAEHGLIVYGLDIQRKPLVWAKELTNNKIPFICGNACELPFKSSMFDIVTLFEVIEHVAFHRHNALLEESKRVLKVKGKLILTTPNRENLRGKIYGYRISPKHWGEYNEKELRGVLESSGFRILKCQGLYLPLLPPGLNTESIIFRPFVTSLFRLGKHFPSLSFRIFVIAEKRSLL